MATYEYWLTEDLHYDFTEEQGAILKEDGYVFNTETDGWEKFEIKTKVFTHLDLVYSEEVEVEVLTSKYLKRHAYTVDYIDYVKKSVPVNEYITRHDVEVEFQEPRHIERELFRYELEKDNEKIFSVSYIERGESFLSGFLNFFKKALNIKKTEPAATLVRLSTLRKQQSLGKITNLEIETVNDGKSTMDMTEGEFRKMFGKWFRILQLEDESVWTREVREIVKDTEIMEANMVPVFSRGREGREILKKKDIIETVELTAREYQDRGEALKLHRPDVKKKEETTEIQGHATIEAGEYKDFMAGKKEISKAEIKELVELSDREYMDQVKAGNNYPLVDRDSGKKMEIQEQIGKETILEEEYDNFMRDKKEISRKEWTEEKEISRELVDEAFPREFNDIIYIPYIYDTRAVLHAGFHIEYLAWPFEPLDPEFIDRKEMEQRLIEGFIEGKGDTLGLDFFVSNITRGMLKK